MGINKLIENGTIVFSELNDIQKEEVKERVCVENKGLIISLLTFNQVRNEDYIQEGYVGLLIALERFDYTKGFKFSSYAYYWINQRVKDFYRKNFMIRNPANSKKERHYVDFFESETGFEATIESFEDDKIFNIMVKEFSNILSDAEKILFQELFIDKVKVRPDLVDKYGISGTTLYKQRQALQKKFKTFFKKRGWKI